MKTSFHFSPTSFHRRLGRLCYGPNELIIVCQKSTALKIKAWLLAIDYRLQVNSAPKLPITCSLQPVAFRRICRLNG